MKNKDISFEERAEGFRKDMIKVIKKWGIGIKPMPVISTDGTIIAEDHIIDLTKQHGTGTKK